MGPRAPHPGEGEFRPPAARGVSGATLPRTPRFRSCGGYPPPHPGVHFWTPKSEPKNRQNQGFGFLCLIGLYQWGNFSATESGFGHLIYSGSVNVASADALLKRWMFLGVRVETSFLGCTSGSIRRNSGQVSSHAGESKGGEPPLCRRGGGVHRGGTPSKGSRPYAAFWLLFVRTKSNSGCGAEGPTYKRYGSNAPHIGQKRHHGTLSASIRSEPAPSRHMSSRLMLLGSPPDMVHRHPLRETRTSTRMLAENIPWCSWYYTR